MRLKFTLLSAIILISINTEAQNWVEKAAHPGDARHHPVTFVIDNMAYLLTGSTNSSVMNDFYQYDPVNDSWTTLPDFPGDARSYAYGAATADKAYVGFGASEFAYLDDLWEYDPSTGNWTELTPCPCAGRAHPTFVIQDQKLFVGQGSNTANLIDWWEYDIVSDSWTQKTNLPGPARHHPFYFAAGGYVYTGMGHGSGIYKDWYRWDLDTDTWQQMNDFPDQGRVAGTQLNINDRGFVLSGDGEDHGTIATGEFWEYDYQTDTWLNLPPHPEVSRWAPGSFAIGNTVYLTSGEIRNGNPNAGLKNDLWSFDLDVFASTQNITKETDKINVYPNPTKEYLSLKGVDFSNTISIKVYDSSGKTVKSGDLNSETINVSDLQNGFYFISVTVDDQLIDRIKFIKK